MSTTIQDQIIVGSSAASDISPPEMPASPPAYPADHLAVSATRSHYFDVVAGGATQRIDGVSSSLIAANYAAPWRQWSAWTNCRFDIRRQLCRW